MEEEVLKNIVAQYKLQKKKKDKIKSIEASILELKKINLLKNILI
jgi:hypothetical protein